MSTGAVIAIVVIVTAVAGIGGALGYRVYTQGTESLPLPSFCRREESFQFEKLTVGGLGSGDDEWGGL